MLVHLYRCHRLASKPLPVLPMASLILAATCYSSLNQFSQLGCVQPVDSCACILCLSSCCDQPFASGLCHRGYIVGSAVHVCSVHERFCQAATSTDQIADSNAAQQHDSNSSCPDQPLIAYTPAPDTDGRPSVPHSFRSRQDQSPQADTAAADVAKQEADAADSAVGQLPQAEEAVHVRTDSSPTVSYGVQEPVQSQRHAQDTPADPTELQQTSANSQREPDDNLEQDHVSSSGMSDSDDAGLAAGVPIEAPGMQKEALESGISETDMEGRLHRRPLAALQQKHTAAVQKQSFKASSNLQEQGVDENASRAHGIGRSLTKHASLRPQMGSSASVLPGEDVTSVNQQMQKLQASLQSRDFVVQAEITLH